MSYKSLPRPLRPWLKPTELERTPTDDALDYDIHLAIDLMHWLIPILKKIVRNKIRRAFVYRWRYMLTRAVVLSAFIWLIAFGVKQYYKVDVKYVRNLVVDTIYVPDSLRTIEKFLYHIGTTESGNNYGIISPNGMLGYWQFSPGTLVGLGINVKQNDFLNSPTLQRATMLLYMKKNKEYFAREIARYNGTYVGGVLVTESGILAGAHLKPAAMLEWLVSNGSVDGCDGNGTTVSYYIKRFAGYRIKLD